MRRELEPDSDRPPHAPTDLQRRFDKLLDHLPAGVVVHDTSGRIVASNRLALALLECSEEALIGAAPDTATWQLKSHDNTALALDEYPSTRVLRTGETIFGMIVGIPPGPVPTHRWLICNAYPEHDEQGRLQGAVVCFTDCTELKRAQQDLQQSEQRLRLMLLGSSDGAWDWDLATNEIYYSERWWEMLGHAPDDMASDVDAWHRLMHPEDLPRVIAFVTELVASRRQVYSLECRLRHCDGHYVPVLARAYVLRDAAGKALRISGTNTDLTERKRNERRIYELAYFDHLTGLPNRRFLIEELDKTLARSCRAGQLGAVLFIDLDNFKLLNDTMGHDVGDMLLRQVAQRLRQALRDSDQLARLGGDEFVVVLENLGASSSDATAHADQVARKILALLGQPYDLPGTTFTTTPSIGITLFDGAAGGIETLLKQADLAMYRAKNDGRNTARFFDPSMQAAADRQAALDSALREGLAHREFVLFCQPQFDRAGRLIGAEVLARWQHGEHGLVGPDEFIGQAETTGLIVPLGLQVLEEACGALARWARDPALGQVRLAVNVSAQQLRDPDFPQALSQLLAATGASADRLCLELRESVFTENVQELIDRMQRLSHQGVRFSLDDFGTGHSSLAYLMRFPLAALKIDRSFVQDVGANGMPIVEAIVALARKLRLDVIAEGVEHESQRRFMLDCGCDTLQGYLLGRPVPLGEFERMYAGAAQPAPGYH